MADRASSFLRDWISTNIHNNSLWGDDLEGRVQAEITKLKAYAEKAGIDLGDPELANDLLHDEITAAIERVYDPEVGGIKD